jgi:dienelactone hydrolase
MKTNVKFNLVILVLGMTILTSFTKAEKAKSSIKEENITYIVDGVTMNGFIAYNSDLKGKRPAILVVPEWWGLNDYPKNRARQLASLGYIAMAVDMYGNGKIAADPKEAQALAGTFYQNPQLGKTRLDAAIKKIKEFQQTLKGVVSFHGGLAGVKPDKNLLKAKILVCHGGSDKFVPQHDVDVFKHQLDSVGANYTVNVYPNATHAFSNPDATATGKKFNMPIEYNAEADKNSWNDMKMFFASLFK